MPKAYYNEFDPNAAAWLRQLIKEGLIADGDVDDRSILEVHPNDFKGYTQHHFFAGIGGWSLALRMAGWPDDRPVCTASLPCQPFSTAGNQKGKQDERHLLPHFLTLVDEADWPTIFGEQVPAAIQHGWLDDLYNEMGSKAYTTGATILTATGTGAPHIRQRLYWGACRIPHPQSAKLQWDGATWCRGQRPTDNSRRLGNAQHNGHPPDSKSSSDVQPSEERWQNGEDFPRQPAGASDTRNGSSLPGREDRCREWVDPDWIHCQDGKLRPVKPQICRLVDGLSRNVVQGCGGSLPTARKRSAEQEARATRIKGYGNAIVPQVAANFIEVFMNVTKEPIWN